MITTICFLLNAIVFIAGILLFISRKRYVNEVLKINIDGLKLYEKDEKFECGSAYLSKKITELLKSKKNKQIISETSVLLENYKYNKGFIKYVTLLTSVILVVFVYFYAFQYAFYKQPMIMLNIAIAIVVYIISLILDKILFNKNADVENVYSAIIHKFDLMNVVSKEKEREQKFKGITSKLDTNVQNNIKLTESSAELVKRVQSVQESIKQIYGMVKNFGELQNNEEDVEFGKKIEQLKNSVANIEKQYANMSESKEKYDTEMQNYIEFFKEYNNFYNSILKIDEDIAKLFDNIKTEKIDVANQLSDIKGLLRAINAKQINEVKMIVDGYVNDVFSKISFLMESNLERSNQIASSNEKMISQSYDIVVAMNDYSTILEKTLAARMEYNNKLYMEIDANVQLVNFLLKRHKYMDASLFGKLGKLVTEAPMKSTDGELYAIRDKLNKIERGIAELNKPKAKKKTDSKPVVTGNANNKVTPAVKQSNGLGRIEQLISSGEISEKNEMKGIELSVEDNVVKVTNVANENARFFYDISIFSNFSNVYGDLYLYPDNSILERAWDVVYTPWFDINRKSTNGRNISQFRPLLLKKGQNPNDGYFIASKGSITIE